MPLVLTASGGGGVALEADTPVTAGKKSVGDTGTPEEAAAGSL